MMALSSIEKQRLMDGNRLAKIRSFSTAEWRFYFSYLLGRDITLRDTDEYLREEQIEARSAV